MQKKVNNKSKSPKSKSSVPAAVAGKRSDTNSPARVVEGREFLFNLSGNSAPFLLLGSSGTFPGYDLNPGNRLIFPWLSLTAQAYEKYRFDMLEFEVVPRNPTSSAGAVYSAVDYDWDDNPATSAAELMTNLGAVSSDVWTPHVLKVDCRRLNEDVPFRYVADMPRTDSSQRMVYAGFFMLGIAGTTGTVSFDVFARYRVRYSLPCLHAVDSAASYTYTAPVVAGAGTPSYIPSLPTIVGLASVLSGVAGVPLLATAPSGAPAYKLGSVNRGELSLVAQPATAGSPPSTYAADTYLDGFICDAVGNLLGFLSTGSVSSVQAQFPGPDTAATWATNGALGKAAYSISMAVLRRAFPLAMYIVPYLASAAGRTYSTSTKFSSRYTEI